jgi:peptide/nickel transport system permease protein
MATLPPSDVAAGAETPEQPAELMPGRPLTPNQLVWRRFMRHRAAVAGAVGLLLIAALIVVGSLLTPADRAIRPEVANRLAPPTPPGQWASLPAKDIHPFGTDATGRDVFARILYGGQISLAVGVLSILISLLVGVTIGAVAGYVGGAADSVLMRFTEAMLAIPSLFLLIVLGKLLGSKLGTFSVFGMSVSGSVVVVILVIGLTSWMYEARIVRANVLSLREREYVAASEALGAGRARILWRHVLPNTVAPIIVAATLGLATAIGLEAYASFLGLGVQDPPTASWGNMISQALNYMQSSPPKWWLWLFPGLFITMTVLCINFVGDGLRDALDPRRKV